ncbi:6-phosphogluconate dehydrogenase [Mycobacterium sp. 852002-53434_SCH5985345]|uniref:NAD(P)-dependent oxidoreductase n=1 Tax=Mycobacterium sp. 852002-53434_SCH5985345 TaxID=1834107 RepID=UPI00080092AE|nr:NAD(P)-dependent oxidoreductase [Mycobacterium sp. 852002-53434_SCH5985345]OBF51692.1 6-phosphogluconate dehydrogenase [Mycobacterium sp. 852002-53434_SCH5985345]
MDIGFIGLGNMGRGMAANLIGAGHQVTVYNRSPGKAEGLVERGATAASTVAEACTGDVVFTMLADDHAVEAVAFGGHGILAALAAGATHVSSSTISVALSEHLATAHAEAGQRYAAAPVFGRPEAAAAAKLFVVAAGEPQVLQPLSPLFDTIGQRTFVVSEQPHSANLVKLSGNFLIASVIESVSEAVALVAKAGVDRQQYVDILTSTLFAAPVYQTYGGLIARREFEPAGFAAQLGLKDVRLALAAAEQLQVPLPVASLLRDRFLTLVATGGGHLDWSALATLADRDAGLGSDDSA